MAETVLFPVTATATDATHATTGAEITTRSGRLKSLTLYRASSASTPAEYHARLYKDAALERLLATFDLTATTDPLMPADTEFAKIPYDSKFDALYLTHATDTGTLTGNLEIEYELDPEISPEPTGLTITG